MKIIELFEAIDKKSKIEKLSIDLEVGDEISMGRYKNKKATIKGFTKNKRNQPVAKTNKGEKNVLNFDVEKLKETQLKWAVGKNADKGKDREANKLNQQIYKVVWVNIEKLIANTDPIQKIDISSQAGDNNVIGDRINRAKAFFQQQEYPLNSKRTEIGNGYMEPSMIHITDKGTINFTDGRHRLVAAHQLGAKIAPVLVRRDQNQEGRLKEFGFTV